MKHPTEKARAERLGEVLEAARQSQRRERAFLRSPQSAPEGFSKKTMRRLYQEAAEELRQRG